jgi:hypothetical protein
MRFESVYTRALTFLKEGPTELEDYEPALVTAKEIKDKKLPTSWPKPLVQIDSDEDRREAVAQVMKLVFGDEGVNKNIHDKKALQAALKTAIMDYSSKPGSKFKRPVSNTFAGFLGNWLGTNIKTKITPKGTEIVAKTPEAAVPSMDALSKAFDDAIASKDKRAKDAAQELKATAKEEETPAASEETKVEGSKQELDAEKEYKVFESTYEEILAKVEKANKKAYRYGIPQIVVTKTGETYETVSGKTTKYKLINFKISQPSPKMNGGWKFIARVDHEDFGNMIVKAPGTDEFEGKLHEMFGSGQPSYCDHCKKKRNRTSTFIVQDQQGNLKRIGKACLKDYLPGGASDVQKLIHWGEEWVGIVLNDIKISSDSDDGGGERGGGGGSGGPRYAGIEYTLGLGLFIADTFGYLSSKNARNNFETGGPTESTADKVKKVLEGAFTTEERKQDLYEKTQEYLDNEEQRKEYEQKAKEILDWAPAYIEAQLRDPSSQMGDYFRNLKLMVDAAKNPETAYISHKHVGYILGLIPMFQRAKQDKSETAKAGKKPSEYVGTIGLPIGTLTSADKRKIKNSGANINVDEFPYNGPINLKVTSTRNFATQGFGYYQREAVAYMTSFEGEDGAVYVWIATFDPGFKEGQEVVLERATVKNHKDYVNKKTGNVIKQTILKRPKFEGQAEAE